MIIAGCVALVLLLIAGWRIEAWLRDRAATRDALDRARLDQQRTLKERELALKEHELELAHEKPMVEPPRLEDFPPELLARANEESEEWAREDMRQLMVDAYVEMAGDWDRASVYVAHRVASQPASRLPKHLH